MEHNPLAVPDLRLSIIRLSFAWPSLSLAFAFVPNSCGSAPVENAGWLATRLVADVVIASTGNHRHTRFIPFKQTAPGPSC